MLLDSHCPLACCVRQAPVLHGWADKLREDDDDVEVAAGKGKGDMEIDQGEGAGGEEDGGSEGHEEEEVDVSRGLSTAHLSTLSGVAVSLVSAGDPGVTAQ